MGAMIKMVIVMITLHLTFYVGISLISVNNVVTNVSQTMASEGGFPLHIENDLITYFMGQTAQEFIINQTKAGNYVYSSFTNNSDINIVPDKKTGTLGGSIVSTEFGMLDALSITWLIVPTLFNVATAPLTILTYEKTPVYFSLFIGVVWFIAFILTVYSFIRGIGD